MPKKGRIGDRYKKVKISNEKIRQRNKKEYAKIIVLAVFLLVITIGGSYALFQTTIKGNKQTEVVAGTLKVEYEDKNTISLNNASPLTDVEGLNQEPYTFTVRNIGTLNGKYTIYLEEREGNTLDKSNIKYSIKEGEGDWSSPVLLSSGLVLKENRILEKGEEETYQIKMWLKEDATNEVQGQTYKAKVVVNVVQTNTENIVTTNPVIKLNGESVVKINQNEEYVDAGVSSVSSREEISLDKVKVRYEYNNGETTDSVEKIDTSKVGIYYIYYEVEDSKGIKGVATRVVNVVKKGTNTPTIVLKGEEEISLDYKEKYVEAGYEARDVEDGELTDKVVVEGVVNSEVAGTYIIKYIVIDSEGNTASVVRKVIVNGKSQGLIATVKKEEEENISTTVTIEAETESEKAYYAVTTTDKKPGDSEYKELVNKKVSLNIVKNGRYYIFVKDSKGNVVKKIVDLTNIDETKPSCSFEDGGYVEKGKTKEIELTCTDPADIATTKIETERIEVSDSEVGEVESISIGEKIEKGYKYKVTVRGKNSGNFTLKLRENSVLDKVGNKNEEVESTTAKVVSMNVNTPEIELDLTGTTEKQIEISGTNIGKLSYESNNKEVAIVTEEGIVRAVSPGVTTITVTEANGKITKEVKVKVIKTITVTFTRNGQGVEKISNTTASCEIKDQTLKCKVKMPSMEVKEGYSKVGWNADKEAKEGYKELEEVDIEKDTEFFTISKKNEIELTTTFKRNGAASLDGKEVEELKKTCIIAAVYNDSIQETSCYVTTPIIEASSATPIVIGYGESKDATAGIVKSNENIEISNDITYYALTKNTPKTVTIQFNKNGAKTQSGKEDDIIEKSCTIPITYNGESQNKTCSITSPIIGASTETPTVIGYSTESSRYVNDWSSNDAKEVGENGKYYAQTYKSGKTITITFNKNGAASQTNSSGTAVSDATVTRSCNIATTYNGSAQATSCNITSPVITAPTATPSVYGYSTSSSTHSSSWNSNTTKAVSSNGTYYAQTYKSAVTYTAKWGSNGATLSSTANKTCTIGATYNGTSQGTSCTVTAPTITRSGFTIVGFNTNSGGTTSTLSSGGTLTLTSSNNNSTWYAISSKSVVIKWDANNATISKTQDSCTIWNTATSCNITSPTISRTNYFIIGWNTSSSSTTSAWNTSTQKAVSSSATYYAITELATAVNVTGSTRTLYRSLDAAVEASTSSSTTTTLLKNITEDVWVVTAVTANVNLNSKTMTGIFVNNNASATITLSGGTITNSSDRAIYNKGKMTINSGTYTSSTTNYTEVVWNLSGASMNINGGTISSASIVAVENDGILKINGGTLTSTSKNSLYNGISGNCTILNGILSNSIGWTIRNKGTLNMSGGVVKLTQTGTDGTALYNDVGGITNVTGGTIESTGFGFVNNSELGTDDKNKSTIRNAKISVISSSGYSAVLNRNNSYTYLIDNTIKAARAGYPILNNQGGNLVSYRDKIDELPIYGVVYRYYEFGSGNVEVAVFGRSDITSFPTWSNANGQDDLKWYSATDYSNGYGSYKFVRIYASNHNNEKGTTYTTHIYASSTYVFGFSYTMPA